MLLSRLGAWLLWTLRPKPSVTDVAVITDAVLLALAAISQHASKQQLLLARERLDVAVEKLSKLRTGLMVMLNVHFLDEHWASDKLQRREHAVT